MPYVSTVQDTLPQWLLANKQHYQSYTETFLISQLHLHYVNPNGNFNPRGVQVFCMFSMMASQIGSISYPICRFARSVRLNLLISIPSIISLYTHI